MFRVAMYIIKKLIKHNVPLLKLLRRINFRSNFFFKTKQADVDVCYLVLKVKILYLVFLRLKINFQNRIQINEMKKYGNIRINSMRTYN